MEGMDGSGTKSLNQDYSLTEWGNSSLEMPILFIQLILLKILYCFLEN